MKKAFISVFAVIMLFCLSLTAFAVDETKADVKNEPQPETQPAAKVEEPTQDMSAVRLIVTDFTVENDCIVPGEKSAISITVKNTNSAKAVRNAIFTLTDGEKQLVPDGMGNVYVDYFESSYTWETTLTAVNTASEGRHELTLTVQYEDRYYSPYSETVTLYVDVKQPVSLDFSGLNLPAKAQQSSTVTIVPEIMNTGKGVISNIKINTKIDGLTTGGTCFIGNLAAGESKSGNINMQVSDKKLGKTEGKITISYEDCYGKTHTQEVDISTNIIEKIEVAATEEEKTFADIIPWWLFLAGGALVGGGIGCAIPIAIYSKKQREADEKRL